MKATGRIIYFVGTAAILFGITSYGCHRLLIYLADRQAYEYKTYNFTVHQLEAYAPLVSGEITQRWKDALKAQPVYEPWVGFREADVTTPTVNVRSGIRLNRNVVSNESETKNASSEKIFAIWFFGGSTTYGYGLSDEETIPAKLEGILGPKYRVLNFGRGHYYSAQENALLLSRLLQGEKPDLAVFLDGLNERCDIASYQNELSSAFDAIAGGYRWHYDEIIKPVRYVLGIFKGILLSWRDQDSDKKIRNVHNKLNCDTHPLPGAGPADTRGLDSVVGANLQQRNFICSNYEVKCLTFSQPIAGIHGIHSDNILLTPAQRQELKNKFELINPQMRKLGAIDLTDLSGVHKHAYVDDVHYSPTATQKIAESMAKYVQKN